MKIVVTGANGQLGQEIVRLRPAGHEVIGLTRQDMDITDEGSVGRVLDDLKPDTVIHGAAYTAVDNAESNPVEAFAVNAAGTRNVVCAANNVGAKVCYVSTDYVFDGRGTEPYGEYDNTNPQTVYGKSKLAGEVLTSSLSNRWFIVRTSWVYGAYGANFVKTMLAKAKEGANLRVVGDQVGCPTYTKDLARFLVSLVDTEKYGIYHASNSGSCSWYEFAQAIFAEAGLTPSLSVCTTADFPRPAPRPANSVLGDIAIRANGLKSLRPWRDALREYIREGVE